MTVNTIDLADFVLARNAEVQRFAEHCCWPAVSPTDTRPIMRENMLAQCEARRAVVSICEAMLLRADPTKWGFAQNVLAALALPYKRHPDFRDEWRP